MRSACRHRPIPAQPLLLVRLAGMHSGNGDQSVVTWLWRYDRTNDRFVPAYRRLVGHNNDQEVRYMAAGPLRGAVIAAGPTRDAPFGFLMMVDRLGPDGRYGQILRYRSAIRYNDGNSLAVIDSEMPAIEQRLRLRHPGQPMLHPAACPAPRLVKIELCCTARTRAAKAVSNRVTLLP